MKNIVNGLLNEYIKNNATNNVAQMTIGELTIFVAGFIKHFEESVERVLSEMTVSDLVSLKKEQIVGWQRNWAKTLLRLASGVPTLLSQICQL